MTSSVLGPLSSPLLPSMSVQLIQCPRLPCLSIIVCVCLCFLFLGMSAQKPWQYMNSGNMFQLILLDICPAVHEIDEFVCVWVCVCASVSRKPKHYIITLHCYITLLHYTITLHCYITLLHDIITLHYYITLLH